MGDGYYVGKQSCCTGVPPDSLMNRMPALDTVAGVAFFSELISNTIRMASLRGTRSFDTSVSTYVRTSAHRVVKYIRGQHACLAACSFAVRPAWREAGFPTL